MTGDFSFPLILGYLLPIGFFLLAWGGMEPERARRAAIQGLVALALATVGYFATGFAFHLGGAAVFSDRPGLGALDSIWSPLDRVRGLGWGVIGLKGFFLGQGADTPQALALFAAYLPMAATAVLLPVLALFGRARGGWVALMGLLTGALLFPLAACWVWGGGWLASMGQTLARGHGAVDHAGSGVVYLLGGMVAWGALTALGREPPQEGPAEMPPAHFPLLANLGVLLVVVGWLGWSLSGPLHADGARLDAGRIAVNGSLALAGATLTSLFYCWLALGRGDSLMVARGAAGGLVALSAGAPFLPPWAALVVGGVAGLLVPLGVYLVDRLLRLADATAAVAVAALPGLWGLLAVALFADGRWGQGWNGVGAEVYRTVIGQGVSGFLVAPGFLGDGPGQMVAQVVAVVAIGLLGFAGGWLTMAAARWRQ
jgi:Amt family ammonium transporter